MPARAQTTPHVAPRRGFTLTEMLIVIGLLVLLVSLLLPALASVQSTGRMTDSMNKMRQTAQWMGLYSSDYNDTILASQFNHIGDAFEGYARCGPPFSGVWHSRGTWADTLWTRHELGVFPEAGIALGSDYHNDSPDKRLYEYLNDIPNPLRSKEANSRNYPGGMPFAGTTNAATPFGTGAQEQGLPGYFAANNFFNADDEKDSTFNGTWSNGQMRFPDRSMYLVDSFAGEVIEDEDADDDGGDPRIDPFNNEVDSETIQVDFRYNNTCLMLFLDGHVSAVSPWLTLDELEMNRKIRVRELNTR